MDQYLYVAPNLGEVAVIGSDRLAATEDRHRVPLGTVYTAVCFEPLAELARRPDLKGVVISLDRGWPGISHLRFARRVLQRGLGAWLYWPREEAVERLDAERLSSYRRHWMVISVHRLKRAIHRRLFGPEPPPDATTILAERTLEQLNRFAKDAKPVPFRLGSAPSAESPFDGVGAYVRTDFWVQISSGGSYGHTCYVARELAASSRDFVCVMANRYSLLDELGVRQLVVPRLSESSLEGDLLAGTSYFHGMLNLAFQATRPSYIYERLCLGNFACAQLSHELQIPYIVEYNGSEISMRRSFDGQGFDHERVFTQVEAAAFRQATLISVVSDAIAQTLVARGIDPEKILVNPNGADPEAYAPLSPDAKQRLRAELGFAVTDRVVGFTGTFGGWHGVDVLAEAIPKICERAPTARFLLIGDGPNKHMIDEAVRTHGLASRVHCVGRVPQAEGARLLGACDIYVSPHNSHMVDSRFFGSPTKLFEYMAMGGGIVASDLEQLGDVLSPALRVADFADGTPEVSLQRAVLCTPGDVDEFTAAVVKLGEHSSVCEAIGRNARAAILDHYSWRRHVERVWQFAAGQEAPALAEVGGSAAPLAGSDTARIATGDDYKEQVQDQWNTNPVGPQYARTSRAHTLEWYQEIETHRYGVYGPWMPDVMEFSKHAGKDLLEIGGGIGTDLSQFARHGARVTDLDLSAGHMAHAKENFELRGLTARFVHQDAERIPFDDNSFDVVYSNGVLHHTPHTRKVVAEIKRVLKPGGKAIVMMYAEDSLHYWLKLVWQLGLDKKTLLGWSMHEIMSGSVELTTNDAKPLVKVYSRRRLRELFKGFDDVSIVKRQLMASELPEWLKWVPLATAERLMGWNLVIKAHKPQQA